MELRGVEVQGHPCGDPGEAAPIAGEDGGALAAPAVVAKPQRRPICRRMKALDWWRRRQSTSGVRRERICSGTLEIVKLKTSVPSILKLPPRGRAMALEPAVPFAKAHSPAPRPTSAANPTSLNMKAVAWSFASTRSERTSPPQTRTRRTAGWSSKCAAAWSATMKPAHPWLRSSASTCSPSPSSRCSRQESGGASRRGVCVTHRSASTPARSPPKSAPAAARARSAAAVPGAARKTCLTPTTFS